VKTVAFFSTRGGVGKTTLVYHLAHMLAEQGETVLAVDLDPQASLTRMFSSEERLETLWLERAHTGTIYDALRLMLNGEEEVPVPAPERIVNGLSLVSGDPALATTEEFLSYAWFGTRQGDPVALRITTALSRVVNASAREAAATWVLIDSGPNLDAITRAALIASDHVVIPLLPDAFSLPGLQILGLALQRWRSGWMDVAASSPDPWLAASARRMKPLGYVLMQHNLHENRSRRGHERWSSLFPEAYRKAVLGESPFDLPPTEQDPYCLAVLKHYRSLMPMAMEARKPVFALTPADGAIGAHVEASRHAYKDFLTLARRLAERSELTAF